jgi:hypothetical protein
MEINMTRLIRIATISLSSLLSLTAFAQQPPTLATPAPAAQPDYPQQYYPPQAYPAPRPDPNADDADDDDYGYDVTYDVSTQEQPYDDGYDPNAYQQFEGALAPYGTWQEVPSYGHVWMPSPSVVGSDFEPYDSGGQFVMSDYGWAWSSDWDWGWAPFHYGRWMVIGGYGWCWMPGTTWGPAWVNWRWGNGYVGWSPLAPHGVVIGPPSGRRGPWRFTLAGQLGWRRPSYLPARVVPSVFGRTTPIHNVQQVAIGGTPVRINAGPSSAMVAQATGRPMTPVSLAAVAPRALPRPNIVPHLGTPLQSRPWMQSRPIGGAFSHTVDGARTIGAPRPMAPTQRPASPPPAYRPGRLGAVYSPTAAGPWRPSAPIYHYSQPAYHYSPPAAHYYSPPAYHPAAPAYHYSAPAPSYRYSAAPSYHYSAPAPSYHYNAPAPSYHYNAPAPSYHYSAPAPSYHSAPAPSFHSSGGSFHGGGHR